MERLKLVNKCHVVGNFGKDFSLAFGEFSKDHQIKKKIANLHAHLWY